MELLESTRPYTKTGSAHPDFSDKTILAHKGFFNKESEKTYKENSAGVCKISGARDEIGIIELDLRKSRDGILYCYHGTPFEYLCGLKFPMDFSRIKLKYGVDTLREILGVIGRDKIIFLDIKDRRITKDDILRAFGGRKFKEVILGNKSASFLRRFGGMPGNFAKILNGNIFCGFYDLEKLARDGFKYFEVVFPFQVSARLVERVRRAGMEFRCASLFFKNKESYWKKMAAYGITQVSSDFI
ncbi:MAG: hypothetical protein KGI73_04910 [Patescibacteria group bacterium]|nr:hypothetical protein [Patescibacteria group bacterium]